MTEGEIETSSGVEVTEDTTGTAASGAVAWACCGILLIADKIKPVANPRTVDLPFEERPERSD